MSRRALPASTSATTAGTIGNSTQEPIALTSAMIAVLSVCGTPRTAAAPPGPAQGGEAGEGGGPYPPTGTPADAPDHRGSDGEENGSCGDVLTRAAYGGHGDGRLPFQEAAVGRACGAQLR